MLFIELKNESQELQESINQTLSENLQFEDYIKIKILNSLLQNLKKAITKSKIQRLKTVILTIADLQNKEIEEINNFSEVRIEKIKKGFESRATIKEVSERLNHGLQAQIQEKKHHIEILHSELFNNNDFQKLYQIYDFLMYLENLLTEYLTQLKQISSQEVSIIIPSLCPSKIKQFPSWLMDIERDLDESIAAVSRDFIAFRKKSLLSL